MTAPDRPPVGELERRAWIAVVGMTALLGLAGFVVSFHNVSERMAPYFGDLAPLVPLAIDLGIAVFTALDLLMAFRDVRSRWLRLVPWGLTVATIYLNAVGAETLEGRVAHAVLPALWVVAVEVGGSAARAIFGLREHVARMDRVRRSRWVLAPITTALLRRRMILWELTSYRDALARERDRVLARTDLQDRYGWRWRWKAPRRERALYRLGELAPVTVPDEEEDQGTAVPGQAHMAVSGRAVEVQLLHVTEDQAREAARPVLVPPPAPGPDPGAVDRVLEQYRRTRATPGRRQIIADVQAAGGRLGTTRANELAALLRAEAEEEAAS